MKNIGPKLYVGFLIAVLAYCAVILYGQIRFSQDCSASGGVALRKAWGGTYCLTPPFRGS